MGEIADALSRLESRAIGVHARQCVRFRHRRATCARCAEACPTHAITWGESLRIDADKCNGCGVCATICPTGALEAQTPTPEKLLALVESRVKEPAAIVFACARYLRSESDHTCFVHVRCLGRLDESILVGAVAAGATSVCLMDGACDGCPNTTGRTIAEQMVQTANVLLQAWNIPPRIKLISQLPPEAKMPAQSPALANGLSRRAFFKLLTRRDVGATSATAGKVSALDTASATDTPEPKKGELPTRLPVKRQMLLNTLRRIGQPAIREYASGLWAQFSFQAGCTGCQMCAFFCPTGALTKIEQDGQVGVAFRPAYCTNCGLCQAVCYRNAVTLSCTVDLSKVFEDGTDTYLMQPAGARGQPGSPQEKFERLFKTNQKIS